MTTTAHLVVPTLLGLSFSLVSPVSSQDPGRAGAALAAQIPAIAEPLEADRLLSGSLSVAHGGEIVFRASYGMANYELSARNGPDTLFCVASVSKPITALAVARLVDAGRLDLDAVVETWIEGFPSGDEMTLMQLMKHTAGIPHRVTSPTEQTVPISAAMIVARIKKRPLLFKPGTGTRYSTAGYSVVARIIEIVTGEDYDAAMRELIFDPLGMKSTCHVDGRTVVRGRAQCYLRVAEGLENAPLSDLSFLVGGGSLYSTADDLVRFGIACSRRQGLPEGTWSVFRERLGWMNSSVVRWNGKTNQFGAFLDLHLDQDLVVAFTGNAGVSRGAVLREAVPKIVAGENVTPPARLSGRRFTEEQAAPFVGLYRRDDGIPTTVSLHAGALQTSGGGVLLPLAEDLFFSPAYGCDVTFDMADDGAATALVYRPVDMAPIIFKRVGGVPSAAERKPTRHR